MATTEQQITDAVASEVKSRVDGLMQMVTNLETKLNGGTAVTAADLADVKRALERLFTGP